MLKTFIAMDIAATLHGVIAGFISLNRMSYKKRVSDKFETKKNLPFTTDSLRSTGLGVLLKCRFLITSSRHSDSLDLR